MSNFQEKKDHLINKLNLTPSQKKILINHLEQFPHKESMIDWNNKDLKWEDFAELLVSKSRTFRKKQVKQLGIKGLEEGKDYTLLLNDYPIVVVVPHSHEASVLIASKDVGGVEGKWCTATTKNDSYWIDYLKKKNTTLLYAINYEKHEKMALYFNIEDAILPENINSIYNASSVWTHDDVKVSTLNFINFINNRPLENLIYDKFLRMWGRSDEAQSFYDMIAEAVEASNKLKVLEKKIFGPDFEWRGGVFSLKNEFARWVGGTFYSGTWMDGVWEKGTWKDGVWVSGTWEDGTWEGGKWYNGLWKGGIWKSSLWKEGIWEDGDWYGGIWKNGTWEDGIWKDGVWHDGIWKNGTWEDGIWKDGVWHDGIWKNGTWEDGVWEGGSWEGGVWEYGRWQGGEWKGGEWRHGYIYDNEKWFYTRKNPKEYFESKKQSLQEKKDHIIKKLPNLSDTQKKILIDHLNQYPHKESWIDWNNKNLKWEDFAELLASESKTLKKKQVKKHGIKGLTEGKDYALIYDNYPVVVVEPFTWEASILIASKDVGGVEGKWCVAYQKDKRPWNDYLRYENSFFLYGINYETHEKVAFLYYKKEDPLDIPEKIFPSQYLFVFDHNDKKKTSHFFIDFLFYRDSSEQISKQKDWKKSKEAKIFQDIFEKGLKNSKLIQISENIYGKKSEMSNERDGFNLNDFRNAHWNGGSWKKGLWKGDVWEDGTFRGGIWGGLEWLNGEWEDGFWRGSTWHNGTWENGVWNDGIWKDGVWEDGLWKDGTWENGKWEGGIWRGGVWKQGLILDDGEWIKSSINPKEYFENKEKNQTIILQEKKDHLINKLDLTPSQKKILIDHFEQFPHKESMVDWNNKDLKWEDFAGILASKSKTHIKKQVKKLGIKGLEENKDYTIVYNNYPVVVLVPHNWGASKLIASTDMGGCEGKWCTAYQKEATHWDSYTKKAENALLYAINYDKQEKMALFYKEEYDEFPHDIDVLLEKGRLFAWDQFDEQVPIENFVEFIFNPDEKFNFNLDVNDWELEENLWGKVYDIIKKASEASANLNICTNVFGPNFFWKGGRLSLDKENKAWKGATFLEGEWDRGIWEYGVWENGDWLDGVWYSGKWKDGVWHDGLWGSGEWYNGIWNEGTWEDGTWNTGTWKDGEWRNGVWKGGVWENGLWKDGVWHTGLWENGKFLEGTWKFGLWKNGIWNYGTWEHGLWENGVWKDGLWKAGIWQGGEWEFGYIWDNNRWEPSYVNPNEYFENKKKPLQEKKDHIIKKLPNLSDTQKKILIDHLNQFPHKESWIDWNNKNLKWEDFAELLASKSKTHIKKQVKKHGIKGLTEGKDYILAYENYPVIVTIPLNHRASVLIASKDVGGCEGKWCTAMQKDDRAWKHYTSRSYSMFLYAINYKTREKMALYYNGKDIPDNKNDLEKCFHVFNSKDNKVSVLSFIKFIKNSSYIKDEDYNLLYNIIKTYSKKYGKQLIVYEKGFEWAEGSLNVEKDGITWNGATFLNGTWERGTWKDGLWKNGVWDYGTWKKGVWENGVWEGGEWHNGTWKNGIHKYGEWRNGVWENGVWENGDWWSGEWKKGEWKRGAWCSGVWKTGTWKGGIWKGGQWVDGDWIPGATWEDGVWEDGAWEGGIWKNGTWENGEWEKGIWENGTWKDGTWKDGTWKNGVWENGTKWGGEWQDGIWKNGVWQYGKWIKGIWEDGIWEDGFWKGGEWKGGTWHMGVIWDGDISDWVESEVSPKEYFANKNK